MKKNTLANYLSKLNKQLNKSPNQYPFEIPEQREEDESEEQAEQSKPQAPNYEQVFVGRPLIMDPTSREAKFELVFRLFEQVASMEGIEAEDNSRLLKVK